MKNDTKAAFEQAGILFGIPILFLAVAMLFNVACNAEMCRGKPFPTQEESLHLVVSDITLDISANHVFASDFVRFTHVGDTEEPYVGPVKYEFYRMGVENLDDEFWRNELHFDCEELGDTEFWIRALYAEGHGDALPVRATLTLVDAYGRCGAPMFYEGLNEEVEE